MILCHCRVVTDGDVATALENGARTTAQVCQATGAGQACGGCVLGVRRAIDEFLQHADVAFTAYAEVTMVTAAKENHGTAQPPRRRVA